MYITREGALWGRIPATIGRVFWVSPANTYTVEGNTYSASDGHDGLSPERALRTINQAWALVAADCGDTIVLLPGAHTVTSAILVNISGVTMTGPIGRLDGPVHPKASITGSGSIDLMTLASSTGNSTGNTELSWITFIPVTAKSAINGSAVTVSSPGLHIHHCLFDMATPVVSTSTIGINLSTSTTNSQAYIHDCQFICDGAQGPAITTASIRTLIERCTVLQSAGTWASIFNLAMASTGVLRDCVVLESAASTATVVVNGTSAGSTAAVLVARNMFTLNANPTVDNFTANAGNIALNFETDPGATAGGTMVAAIT